MSPIGPNQTEPDFLRDSDDDDDDVPDAPDACSPAFNRRAILTALPLGIAATSLAATASAASLSSIGSHPITGCDTAQSSETPEARVERLAFELADALQDLDAPVRFATVYPPDIHSDPVLIADLQAVTEATSTVSQELIAAICDHAVKCNAHLRACKAADTVVLGRELSGEERDRLAQAEDAEHAALMALCRHPVHNEPERHERAGYLLGLFRHDELEADIVEAMMIAMAAPVIGLGAVGMPPVFLRQRLRDRA